MKRISVLVVIVLFGVLASYEANAQGSDPIQAIVKLSATFYGEIDEVGKQLVNNRAGVCPGRGQITCQLQAVHRGSVIEESRHRRQAVNHAV